MAAVDDDEQESRTMRWSLDSYITSIYHEDMSLTIRRNGKIFYIEISPSNFVNSPRTKEKYLSFRKALAWAPEDIDPAPEINQNEVIGWAVQPFEPLLTELAPDPMPGDVQVSLREYLHPEFFVLQLDIVDEELRPQRVDGGPPPHQHAGITLFLMLMEGTLSEGFPEEEGFVDEGFFDVTPLADDDLHSREGFLDDVRRWTRLYDPTQVVPIFNDTKDALFERARKVLVDNGQTTCFFKQCHSPLNLLRELRAYKRMAAANMDPELRINHLHGVVWDEGSSCIEGLLMLYIENNGPCQDTLMDRLHEEPPAHLRERWAAQIDSAVASLHGAGVVWGDVEPHHVLIDRDDNAWITAFGGGYTEEWVAADLAQTEEGDLAGVEKVKEFIFHPDFESMRVFHKHI